MNSGGTGARATCLLLVCGILYGAGPGRELRFGISGDPKTFDALHVSDQRSEIIRYLTGGVLVRINRVTDQLEPELAESWSLRDGGRAITFHLRAGLQFSDGSPLTAADVARTFNTALDPKQASPAGDTFRSEGSTGSARGFAASNSRFAMRMPKPGIDRLFDACPSSRQKPANCRLRQDRSSWPSTVPGDFVRLARNPNYWKRDAAGKQLPYLDSIRIDIQPNREIELTRFLRGETQLVNKMDPESFDRVAREKPAAARNLGASLDSEFLWFNQSPSAGMPDWKKKWFTIGRLPPCDQRCRSTATISRASSSAATRIRRQGRSRRRIDSGSMRR